MDMLTAAPLTYNPTSAKLVAGTTNTLTSTVATGHVINGKFGTSLAALTNSATTPTTDAITGLSMVVASSATAGYGAALIFGVNAAGAIKAALGTPVPLDGLGVTTTPANFIVAPQFPAYPDDFCPIAYTLVRSTPSVPTFTVGSSSWANGTTTFQNISVLPGRPQIS